MSRTIRVSRLTGMVSPFSRVAVVTPLLLRGHNGKVRAWIPSREIRATQIFTPLSKGEPKVQKPYHLIVFVT